MTSSASWLAELRQHPTRRLPRMHQQTTRATITGRGKSIGGVERKILLQLLVAVVLEPISSDDVLDVLQRHPACTDFTLQMRLHSVMLPLRLSQRRPSLASIGKEYDPPSGESIVPKNPKSREHSVGVLSCCDPILSNRCVCNSHQTYRASRALDKVAVRYLLSANQSSLYLEGFPEMGDAMTLVVVGIRSVAVVAGLVLVRALLLASPALAGENLAGAGTVAEWRANLGRSEMELHAYLLYRALSTLTMKQAIWSFLIEAKVPRDERGPIHVVKPLAREPGVNDRRRILIGLCASRHSAGVRRYCGPTGRQRLNS